MSRSTPVLVLVLVAAMGCARDPASQGTETDISISETSPSETHLPDVPDLTDLPDDSEETETEGPDDVEVAEVEVEDVACPPHRAPLIVNDVVVDPCGCCAIGGDYCHGLREGGSPFNGECPVTADAVPPCYDGVDPRGCPTRYCEGSCIADE